MDFQFVTLLCLHDINNVLSQANFTICEIERESPSDIYCAVNLTWKKSARSSNCFKTKGNNFIVNLDKFADSAAVVCKSSKPFSTFIEFEDGVPIEQYTKFDQRRLSIDYFDRMSFKYRMDLEIPVYQTTFGQLKYNTVVQYKMFGLNKLSSPTIILWNFLNAGEGTNIEDVHWLSDRYVVNFHEGSINNLIPCVSGSENIAIFRLNNYRTEPNDIRRKTRLEKLDDGFFLYDPSQGFFVNITAYKNYTGKYICTVRNFGEEVDINWIYYNNKTVYFEIRDISGSNQAPGNPLVDIKENGEIVENDKKYYVDFRRLNKEIDRKLNFLKFRNERIFILNGTMNTPRIKMFYLPKTGHFSCHVRQNQASLQQLECNTIYQCELFAKCLFIKDPIEHGLAEINRHTTCLKSISIASGSCSRNKRYEVKSSLSCEIAKPIAKKGIVQCSSESGDVYLQTLYFYGFDNKIYRNFGMLPLDSILKLTEIFPGKYYTYGVFEFKCEAHSFFYTEDLHWLLKFKNGTTISIPNKSQTGIAEVLDLYNENGDPQSFIKIRMGETFLNVSQLICAAPLLTKPGYQWNNISINIQVLESVPPKILTEQTEMKFKIGQLGQGLRCEVNGFPHPEIKWMFNETDIKMPFDVVDNQVYSVLQFPKYQEEFSGEYKCIATNIIGNAATIFTVHTLEETSDKMFYWATLAASCIVILLFTGLLVYFVRQRKEKMKKIREMTEIINILNGNIPSAVEDEIPGPLQIPYDENFEMARNTFFVDKKKPLGSGQYGEVYKGRMETVDGDVAIKTVKKDCPLIVLKALVSELKILVYIGKHENIVQLLGSYTVEIKNGTLFIALEFCALGSLESHLESHRHVFKRNIQLEICNEDNIVGQFNISSFQNMSFSTLLRWSAQIANAMVHLGSKKIIHSDLATRNILLTAEGFCKVTDFGLSRELHNCSEYIKMGEEDMPWKHLALESLTKKKYSTKTDVWAYGITLWEIFSLGADPYPGIKYDLHFIQNLENGFRNLKPKYASEEIYDLMKQCWSAEPVDRPEFETLRQYFEDRLPENNYQNVSICNNAPTTYVTIQDVLTL